jgi:putative phosphoribosyl transferase
MDVGFPNEIGLELSGRLERPEFSAGPVPVIIFAHGFDSSKDSPRGTMVADKIRSLGMATFLIDFTGHGASQGNKHESTIERQVNDLLAAIDFITHLEDIDPTRIGLCGASSGGLVALMAALRDKRVRAVALRGPRTDGMAARAHGFTIPVLIIQGSRDPLLPESENFWRALPGDKSMEIITGADHLFSRPGQIEEVAELTSRWFREVLFIARRKAA